MGRDVGLSDGNSAETKDFSLSDGDGDGVEEEASRVTLCITREGIGPQVRGGSARMTCILPLNESLQAIVCSKPRMTSAAQHTRISGEV